MLWMLLLKLWNRLRILGCEINFGVELVGFMLILLLLLFQLLLLIPRLRSFDVVVVVVEEVRSKG